MLCLDELDTILFNGFKLCVIYVALDRTLTFLTVCLGLGWDRINCLPIWKNISGRVLCFGFNLRMFITH